MISTQLVTVDVHLGHLTEVVLPGFSTSSFYNILFGRKPLGILLEPWAFAEPSVIPYKEIEVDCLMVTHSPSSSVCGLWNVTFLLLPSRDGTGLLSPWNRGMTTQLALANEAQAHMTQVEAQQTLVQRSLISFAAWGFPVKKSGLVSLRMREHMETDSTNFQAD